MNTTVSKSTRTQMAPITKLRNDQYSGSSISGKPTQAQIAARAYEIYVKKGCPQGQSEANWLQAEKELTGRA
jgi:hypothetical protein